MINSSGQVTIARLHIRPPLQGQGHSTRDSQGTITEIIFAIWYSYGEMLMCVCVCVTFLNPHSHSIIIFICVLLITHFLM